MQVWDFSRFTLSLSSDTVDHLNLDHNLVLKGNKKAIDNVCATINRYIQELTDRLDLFHREGDLAFSYIKLNIDYALANARNLARQFGCHPECCVMM